MQKIHTNDFNIVPPRVSSNPAFRPALELF